MSIRKLRFPASLGLAAALLSPALSAKAAEPSAADPVHSVVDKTVGALMKANRIPGMAVAVTVDGKPRVFTYGRTSIENGKPVNERTLFEVGSLSKTFTGTLGAWVEARGKLSFTDPASKHRGELGGTAFDTITLLDLATYTAGGLPLQFPDDVSGEKQSLDFFRNWKPSYPAQTRRLYSNASIGLFGDLAARAEGVPFDELMTKTLLPKLGLENTFLGVPEKERGRYAFGTSRAGKPVRVSPGPMDAQAYGIKTTAGDMIRFVELAMDPASLDEPLRKAVNAAQTGYYRFGATMQGLGWEIYEAPQSQDTLLAGNATEMALEPQPVTRLDPPQAPKADRLVNKTGSTGGFGAYAAFLPEKRIGVVLLANRNYPIAERVKAAWAILSALR
ncbi:class C beta-lactamase [Aureimonas psammosilenae]|uniref:class C beta-lactamase n=1 Tax=Aureimonas psammosilenae TaxID=2495496 RepID=UPI0012604D5E|nr:class C beta-lactamase [Aureimonas psammosilenae]